MARFRMIDNSGGNWPEEQPAKPRSNWPVVLGAALLVVAALAALGVFAWKAGWLSALDRFSESAEPVDISITPSATDGDLLPAEEYEWTYDGQPWDLSLRIPESLYDYYVGMPRAPVEDYSIYVTHPLDDSFIATVAAELKRQAAIKGYDSEETVNFAAGFVQNLAYTEDVGREEYPNYPVETLFNKGGDCEDMAILTAALLQAMDHDAVLIRFSPPVEGESGHMAVGVAVAGVSGSHSYPYDGKSYYYLETTSTWPLGVIPPAILSEYGGKSDAIYALERAPAIQFSGDLKYTLERRWLTDTTVDIGVTVTNWGTADAAGFYVRAYFEDREGGAKSSDTYDLEYGHQISGVTIESIVVPSGGGTMLVELWLDGEVVDDWPAEISTR
jgi:hypothetical protein